MNFWRFDHSIINEKQVLTEHYDFTLVALSLIIIFMASLATQRVSQSIKTAETATQRYIWIASGSLIMGMSIWAMHFIGMLALSLPTAIAYDIEITLLSITPAIIASSVFLTLLSRENFTNMQFYISSASLAIGVGTMHFSGMEAMRADAVIFYPVEQFIFVLLIALILSALSLYFIFYKKIKSPSLIGTAKPYSIKCNYKSIV